MSKKNICLIAFVVALAGVYVVFFCPLVPAPGSCRFPIQAAPAGDRSSARMAFSLGDYYELTEVKVVPLDDYKKNPNVPPLWHLISLDGSDSTEVFSYGEHINGMDPATAGAEPELLLPGVRYRLFVAAGGLKGQHDFYFGNAPTNTSNN